jgi:hypothetical protein
MDARPPFFAKPGARVTLFLIPFACYVMIVFPLLLICRILFNTDPLWIPTGPNRFEMDATVHKLLIAYVCSGPCLAVGALLQWRAREFKVAAWTLVVALVPLLLLAIFAALWVVQRLL